MSVLVRAAVPDRPRLRVCAGASLEGCCTLPLPQIRELSAKSLRSRLRDGLMLALTYDRCAAADVHDLVRREQACCGFLRFDVRESADAVHLTITAPPEAQSAAADLFAHSVA